MLGKGDGLVKPGYDILGLIFYRIELTYGRQIIGLCQFTGVYANYERLSVVAFGTKHSWPCYK